MADLRNGNPKGNGYTIKEILTAHISEDKEHHEQILRELASIREVFAPRMMVTGMFSLLFSLVGALTYYIFVVL